MLQRTRTLLARLTRSESAAARGEEDRRRWERFEARHTVRVHLSIHNDDTITAGVRDVARGGIRLGVDRFIDSGTMLRIDLPSATAVLACVVHVHPMPDGAFVLGCNFSTELSDADLEALGAKRVRPQNGDQRAWDRVSVAGTATYARVSTPAETRAADVRNLSPTGVALRASEEIIPGTLLNLELRDRGGRTVITIVACVVYLATLADGGWLAGCNFIRELYDEDLNALIAPRP
jgi:hypothetical protein